MSMGQMTDRQLLLTLSYAVKRIEDKLDRIVAELAGEGDVDPPPAITLDGEPAGAVRDDSTPL